MTVSEAPLRVAICLSGQPRTWKKCLPWWNNMFSDYPHGVEFDVFFHLWNFNSQSNHLSYLLGQAEPIDTPISQAEMEEIVETLKPLDYIIEGKEVSPVNYLNEILAKPRAQPNPFKSPIAAQWTCSQFYSAMRVAHLKCKQETLTGMSYDVCIRGRTDLVFQKPELHRSLELPKDSTIYGVHTGYDTRVNDYQLGDIFYYADSPTFNKLSNFFRFMPYLKEEMFTNGTPPEFPFAFYTRMLNITISDIHLDIKMRKSAEHVAGMLSVGKSLPSYEIF